MTLGRAALCLAAFVLFSGCAVSAEPASGARGQTLCASVFAAASGSTQPDVHSAASTSLDDAVRACASMDEWIAAAAAFPAPLEGRDAREVLAERCADRRVDLAAFATCHDLAAVLRAAASTPRPTTTHPSGRPRDPSPRRTASPATRAVRATPAERPRRAPIDAVATYILFRTRQRLAFDAFARLWNLGTDASFAGQMGALAATHRAIARMAGREVRWLRGHRALACYAREWSVQLQAWELTVQGGQMMAKAIARFPLGNTSPAFRRYDRALERHEKASVMTSGCRRS